MTDPTGCKPTRVVNLKYEPYEVYIGRPGHGQSGYWGNPSAVGKRCPECGDRHMFPGDTLSCFEQYARRRISNDPTYRERLKGLRGKVLGCFCAPGPCHGDILSKLADELHELDHAS